jgi:magnesium transporter
MAFVSNVIGRPIVDADGETIGKLNEIICTQREGISHPVVVAIETTAHKGSLTIPVSDVTVLLAPVIPLNKRGKEIGHYTPAKNDIFLVRDILDKQIIDTDGVRVVRVNDLELTRVNGDVYISNVDISGEGLMRRLGLSHIPRLLRKAKTSKGTPGFISWDAVELLSPDQPMRLKVASEKIAELHPADLAEILSDLSRDEGSRLLQSLNNETLADTLEEVEPDFQASLVEELPNERVADVLEEMSPDEAADLLAELPEDRSQEILRMMEKDEAEDVRKLLTYPVESAGGIMNTEYVTVPITFTASQVISLLRKLAPEAETVFYIYVTDAENHLKGVFSLRELVIAQASAPVTKFMEDRVVTVTLKESQDEVAKAIAKYNLLAVPVVDDDDCIHGIVTADDALDKIIPTAWKKRLPKFYH